VGNGGIGLQYSISGNATYYAGGGGSVHHYLGGGGMWYWGLGDGGLGGGGAGSPAGTTGVNGTANTGGGGGGSVSGGGNGGSGIVIIRYLTGSVTATGGTVSTDGNYTIHTFTSSGLFEVAPDYVPEFGSWALLLALGIVAAGIIGVRAKN
jgi:hypothetical protein